VAARTRRVLADGFSFEFSPSNQVLSSIVAMIDAERQCCQFLRFQLAVEPAGGPITLDVTGPPGAREFLAAMIEPFMEDLHS